MGQPEGADSVDPVPEDDDTAVDDTALDATAAVDDGELDEAAGDTLPADLDVTGLVGPYEFPNNSKRRIASVLYVVIGAICIWLGFAVESPLVNGGLAVVGVGLVLWAVYGFAVAVDTEVDETDALVAAARTVGFPPGHASAQMGWRGWRSRPVWRILLYSDEEQPRYRALVLVDGVDGRVIEHFVEDNPEDWSEY